MESDKNTKVIPEFVVIGAMRAGTTTLYDMLKEVDGICLSTVKETDYFLDHVYTKNTINWYNSLFKDKSKVCGEISPNYSKRDVFPGVAENLYTHSSNARIIYIVREPIERIISHYKHSYFSGKDVPSPDHLINHPIGEYIISSSKYAYQLEPYISLFGLENILIINFKDLVSDKMGTVNRICQFIGVEGISKAPNVDNINSSNNIAKLPNWFLKLYRYNWVRIVHPLVPGGLMRVLKNILLNINKKKIPAPPSFSSDVISSIHSIIDDDIKRFSEISKIKFK